jgi:Na+-translocating ferredoxin:NAD+ oxidoreductase RnfC subunit
MMDPSVRNRRIVEEAKDPGTAVLILDFVLGFGAHANPCGEAQAAIQEAQTIAKQAGRSLPIFAYICGTERDEQNLEKQREILAALGVHVLGSNQDCAKIAASLILTENRNHDSQ